MTKVKKLYLAACENVLFAKDRACTAGDLDNEAAMDTLRGVACRMSKDEWNMLHFVARARPGV